MKQISLSNDTINPEFMKCRIILRAKCCLRLTPLLFLLFSWMKALIYPISHSYLSMSDMLHADEGINEEFLFCQPLETTSKAVDVFQMLIDFFDKTKLSWSKLVGVCTDGAPTMIGALWIDFPGKAKNPAIQGTYCMIHKTALVSKTVSKRLHEHMSVVIKVVNYVNSSALNTRLFSKLCKDMDANHTALLYYTQVRWLSKGNMLSRIFELSEEVKLFLVAKQKHDLLLAFGRDEFSTPLAYLADIFEALNYCI